MPTRRTTAWLTASLALAAGLGTTLAAAPAHADEELVRVAWVCYVDQEGDVVQEPTEQVVAEWNGIRVLAESRHLCVETQPEDERQIDLQPIHELNPGLEIFEKEVVPEKLSVVQCGKTGATLAPASAGTMPTAKELTKACSVTTPSGSMGTGVTGGGVIGGGLMSRPGAGMPSADSIECGGTVANPYAAGAGGTAGPTNGELLWQLTKDWLGGTAIVTAGAKSVLEGGAAGTFGGAGAVAALEEWGKGVAQTLGNHMEERYREAAGSLSTQASGFADAAQAAAASAAAAAPGSPEAAAAAASAEQAKAAADAAAKAAEEAKTATERAKIAAAHAAALKATEAAKKAAEDAKKKEQEAKEKQQSQPSPSSAPTKGTDPNGTDHKREACEQLRSQLWECEQNGWKSFECQDLANKLAGCQIDLTVALVAEDGMVCGRPYVDEDTVQDAIDHACGLVVAKYGPDSDPCSALVDGVVGSAHHPDGCDPTVAYGGCPSPETGGTLPDDGVVCFPAPPGTPPMPCVDVTGGVGGGGPLVGHLVDEHGTLFLPTEGGLVALGTTDPRQEPVWVRP